jgi:hypothetical protein
VWVRLWAEVFGITGGNLLKINGKSGWTWTSDLAFISSSSTGISRITGVEDARTKGEIFPARACSACG